MMRCESGVATMDGVSSDGSNDRQVVRRQLVHWLNPYIISCHSPSVKKIQHVRYPVVVRRPLGRFAIAKVGTVASINSSEESAHFGRNRKHAACGMLCVPGASDQ